MARKRHQKKVSFMEKVDQMMKLGIKPTAVKKVTIAQAEDDDIFFWADKSWQERIAETERLRRLIWTHRLGKFPSSFTVTGKKISKSELISDDF